MHLNWRNIGRYDQHKIMNMFPTSFALVKNNLAKLLRFYIRYDLWIKHTIIEMFYEIFIFHRGTYYLFDFFPGYVNGNIERSFLM